jgi:hypothetical protein
MVEAPYGFFYRRRPLDLGPGGAHYDSRLAEYANVPRTLGMIISRRLATLHELDTVYGIEDLWNLIEIALVDNHNESIAQRGD